jgi:hypothetical protein
MAARQRGSLIARREDMGQKVFKAGVKKEKGYLYFLDKKGNVARQVMARGGKKSRKKPEVVVKAGVKREDGYLYYIDKQGDVARAKMARGRKRKVAKKAKRKTGRKKR